MRKTRLLRGGVGFYLFYERKMESKDKEIERLLRIRKRGKVFERRLTAVLRSYRKITIWENIRRVKLLLKFKELLIQYFEAVEYSYFCIIENHEALSIKKQINSMLKEVYEIIYLAGVSSIFRRLPKPDSSASREMEDLYDIFDLYHSDIGPRKLIDIVDRVIEIYKNNQVLALFRTCSPFFWLGYLFYCLKHFVKKHN